MNENDKYGTVSQALHWVMAAVVLIAFLYGPGGSETQVYSPQRDFNRQLHETLGVSVLALAVLRLAWRAVASQPDPRPIARWADLLSKIVWICLYALFFLLPATAIAGAWLEGHALTLLGGFRIGPWIAKNHDLGERIATLHTWLGDAIMWLAGLHAAAGIFHHVVMRDGVLTTMLPRWLRIPPSQHRK
jgi:cytochrome b561